MDSHKEVSTPKEASAPKEVSTVFSRAPAGLDAPMVRVEVHLGRGLPAFNLVGLPEAVVRESKERVRAALMTAGYDFPQRRITVNLSPADLPKEGGRFDLPIAVGILAADGKIPPQALEGREFYGELSLGGALRETRKLLPALIAGAKAHREMILPAANALEASLISGAKLRLVNHLSEVLDALEGKAKDGRRRRHGAVPMRRQPTAEHLPANDHSRPAHEHFRSADHCPAANEYPGAAHEHFRSADEHSRPLDSGPSTHPNLNEIRGQYAAKRALEIAAAGEHGLLMIGPPGAGKTLLAQRLPGLLPPLSESEMLEVASLESAAGGRPTRGGRRPFRSPQHTASVAALIGGGAMRPGELSLAHHGVLFLDELPEFPRNALEALREPLESGTVVLARLKRTCVFPARFQLVAAMNPCPCGYAGDSRCRCTAEQVARYKNRLSGPLIDRIDIHVELMALQADQLMGEAPEHTEQRRKLEQEQRLAPARGLEQRCGPEQECGVEQGRELESSETVALRVAAARAVQLQRQGKLNSRLTPTEVAGFCALARDSRALLATAIARLGLSARGYHRVLKVARTCADLRGEADICVTDVAEAVKLRALDRPVN
jgi:magnesium chelatase family protein